MNFPFIYGLLDCVWTKVYHWVQYLNTIKKGNING